MAYKIYVKSNYFYIVDTENDKIFEGLAKDVRVRKEFVDSTDFIFENVNGFSTSLSIPFTSIQDESGVAYTDVATFVSFYEANTGNFNSGEATPQLYAILKVTQSGTDAPIITELVNTYDNNDFTANYASEGIYYIAYSDGDLLPNDFVLFTDNNLLDNNQTSLKLTNIFKFQDSSNVVINTGILDLLNQLQTKNNDILNAIIHIFRK